MGITITRLFVEDRTPGRGIRYWTGTEWSDSWAWFTVSSAAGSYSETIAMEPGNYRTVAFAWDAAGNRGDSGSIYFDVN